MDRSGPPRQMWPTFVHRDTINYPRDLNIVDYLVDQHVEGGDGDRIAILFEDRSLSYSELQLDVNRFARGLLKRGVEIGDRVVIRLPNIPECVIVTLAVMKIGAVPVPTHVALKYSEVEHIVQDCDARIVIAHSRGIEEIMGLISNLGEIRVIEVGQSNNNSPDIENYSEILEQDGSQSFPSVKVDQDEIAVVLYSSGTTGPAKGCIHSHLEYLAVADSYGKEVLNVKKDDVIGGPPSLSFAYGQTGLLAIPLRFGAAISLMEQFEPRRCYELIQKHGITILYGVPKAFRALLGFSDHEQFDIHSLRLSVTAGEPCPPRVQAEWEKRTGSKVFDHLGSTEMFDGFISSSSQFYKTGSIGVPVPGYEVRVLDDNGEDCPPNETGRLVVRGPTGTRYWESQERQISTVRQGWNYTGDLVYRDADGMFWYVSREDDLIKTSGYRVSPFEVEEIILTHPAVNEVAVVGVPDNEGSQKVLAHVVSKSGEEVSSEEIIAFVKERIAFYKAPKEVKFVEILPRGVTGKIRRVALAEAASLPRKSGSR